MANLASNLKELRERAKLTQQQIAEAVGIKRSAYSYYEIGKTSPKIDVLIKIALLYNVSVDEILGDLRASVYRKPETQLRADIPPYEDNKDYKVYDKFNDLSDYEKSMVLKMRLMSPEEKEKLKKYLYESDKK